MTGPDLFSYRVAGQWWVQTERGTRGQRFMRNDVETAIATLERLKSRCDSVIGMLKAGLFVEDANVTAAPYDFRIGEFGVKDLTKKDDEN